MSSPLVYIDDNENPIYYNSLKNVLFIFDYGSQSIIISYLRTKFYINQIVARNVKRNGLDGGHIIYLYCFDTRITTKPLYSWQLMEYLKINYTHNIHCTCDNLWALEATQEREINNFNPMPSKYLIDARSEREVMDLLINLPPIETRVIMLPIETRVIMPPIETELITPSTKTKIITPSTKTEMITLPIETELITPPTETKVITPPSIKPKYNICAGCKNINAFCCCGRTDFVCLCSVLSAVDIRLAAGSYEYKYDSRVYDVSKSQNGNDCHMNHPDDNIYYPSWFLNKCEKIISLAFRFNGSCSNIHLKYMELRNKLKGTNDINEKIICYNDHDDYNDYDNHDDVDGDSLRKLQLYFKNKKDAREFIRECKNQNIGLSLDLKNGDEDDNEDKQLQLHCDAIINNNFLYDLPLEIFILPS